MKTKSLILFFLCIISNAYGQVPVLYYDFENNANRSALEIVTEQFINEGNSTLARASNNGSSISQASGAGQLYGGSSGTGIRSAGWPSSAPNPVTNAKEYYQFTANTSGFSGLSVAFDAVRQGLFPPSTIGVLWSIDGTTFSAAVTAPQSIPSNDFSNVSFVLPTAAENRTSLTIRIYAYGGIDLASGLSLDNLTLRASTITGVKTLLDFDNVGLSMTSGTAYTPTYNNLTVTGSGTVVELNSKLKLSGTFSVINNAAFHLGANAKVTSGSPNSIGDGCVIQVTSASQLGVLKGHFDNQVVNLNPTTSIELKGTAQQTLEAGTLPNLIVNNASGVVTTGNVVINGTLTLKNGTLKPNTHTLTVRGNILRTTGFIDAVNSEIIFGGSSLQTVAANVFSGNVGNITVTNTAGVISSADAVITGVLTLTAGTYDIGNTTHTLQGAINKTAGVLNASSGTLVFEGSTEQNIPNGSIAGGIKNVTVNNNTGITINDDYTISTNLNLQGGTLNLNGKKVTLVGTVSGTGKFKGSATSALAIASSGIAGTLNFDPTTDGSSNALATLDVSSGSATLGTKLHLYTALNVSGGTLDLAAKNLVLKSNAGSTAYVAEIKGTLTGGTNVTVERHNPAASSRRYRLVTSPVSNTTINAAWQEGGKWDGSTANSANGYGTLITGHQQGTSTKANNNGFDFWNAIAGSSASIRYYASGANYSQATWQPVNSTLSPNAFDNHEAYLVFIRGDRSVSTGTTVGSTTLRATGTLKSGSFTINVPGTKSHTLIGNPYASPLDFKAIYDANSTKIKPYFWTWQASLGTGTGGYVLVQPVSPGSSLYETIPGDGTQSAANRLIHSGEGFFVMPATSNSTNSITIGEGHKSTGVPGSSVFRTQEQEAAKLYVNLSTGVDTGKILLDGAVMQFDASSVEKGGINIAKAVNATENLSILKNDKDLIVASGLVPKEGDTLKVRLWNTTNKNYYLEFSDSNLDSLGLFAVLVDNYLGIETILKQNVGYTNYSFRVNSDAASKDRSRFSIVFRKRTTTHQPPIGVTKLSARTEPDGIGLQWKMAEANDIQFHVVEKSGNDQNFETIATVTASGGTGEQQYEMLDPHPYGVTYYRIKSVSRTGKAYYSSSVKIVWQTTRPTVTIYPNPASNGVLHLQFSDKPNGYYICTLYNSQGQKVFTQALVHQGGTATYSLPLSNGVPNGTYSLEIGKGAEKETMKLQIVQ